MCTSTHFAADLVTSAIPASYEWKSSFTQFLFWISRDLSAESVKKNNNIGKMKKIFYFKWIITDFIFSKIKHFKHHNLQFNFFSFLIKVKQFIFHFSDVTTFIFELTVCCQKVAKFQKKSCSSCIRASSAIFSLQEPTALKACCIELYLTWGHSSQSYG